MTLKKVVIGMIGCGFAARLHLEGYKKIYGIEVCIKAASAVGDKKVIEDFARDAGIETIYEDYRHMLKDEEIEVIDICTPPFLHEEMVIDALKAGKHVICEKPLTGYFEQNNKDQDIGFAVAKSEMYQSVMNSLKRIEDAVSISKKQFMYAENWIYASGVQKIKELLIAKNSKILFIHAEESHNGSHAYHAANWKYTGGGVLIRQGCHPISGVLYLKQAEAEMRGEEIQVESVLADVGVTTAGLSEEEHVYIDAHPVDVEDLANITITFSDKSKAHIISGDMVVGGMRNCMDVYTNNAVHKCSINPNTSLVSYHADEVGLSDVYIAEKVGTKQGWQFVGLEEEVMRGYAGELQDFMECAAYDRKPLSDFKIAYDTAKVMYAAYQSAEENRRICLIDHTEVREDLC